jgi:hypothetical protein
MAMDKRLLRAFALTLLIIGGTAAIGIGANNAGVVHRRAHAERPAGGSRTTDPGTVTST